MMSHFAVYVRTRALRRRIDIVSSPLVRNDDLFLSLARESLWFSQNSYESAALSCRQLFSESSGGMRDACFVPHKARARTCISFPASLASLRVSNTHENIRRRDI